MENFCAVDVFCLFQAYKVQCAVNFLNLCALFLSEELGNAVFSAVSFATEYIVSLYIYTNLQNTQFTHSNF